MDTESTQISVCPNPITAPPRWVVHLFADRTAHVDPVQTRFVTYRQWEMEGCLWIEVEAIPKVNETSQPLKNQVRHVFSQVARMLIRRLDIRPIRFWNFVPKIHRCEIGELNQYMVFNAERYKAYQKWPVLLGHDGTAVASTGLDVHMDRFTMHVLAATSPAHSIDNPRQVPPDRYSKRYGPLPPCFARATALMHPIKTEAAMLLISGTASVVGESTRYTNHMESQLFETLKNLEALIDAAGLSTAGDDALSLIQELRVYLVDMHAADWISQVLRQRLPQLVHVEFVPAALCRRNLLVEIEGIATAPQAATPFRGLHELRGRSLPVSMP